MRILSHRILCLSNKLGKCKDALLPKCNIDQMVPVYEEMRKDLLEGNTAFADKLRQIAKLTGQTPEIFISMLSNGALDFAQLKGQLMTVRNSIQRRLFSICFCEDPYNETLWLKYAGNYSGFVQIYNLNSIDTFLCGTGKECQNCISAKERPYIYPVYYSDIRYDPYTFIGLLSNLSESLI